jgi:nucleotide-binding universal stress UspA family protein
MHQRLLVTMSSTSVLPGPDIRITQADHQAYLHALDFVSQQGVGAIRLVHVVDFLDEDLADDDPTKALVDVRAALEEQLEQACAMGRERGIEVSWTLESGTAWYEILRAAHAFSADLIVTSPRRSMIGFGERLLHGSTARRLIRKAAQPVWIVEPEMKVGIQRVLAAVDLGATTANVIAAADALATLDSAERHLLHCLDYPADMALHHLPDAEAAVAEYHASVESEARKTLDTLCDTTAWTVHLEKEWVVDSVPKIIAQCDIDLVVLGCVSKPWIAGWFLGTSAEKIIERATVSVWVVRPDGWQSPVHFDDE